MVRPNSLAEMRRDLVRWGSPAPSRSHVGEVGALAGVRLRPKYGYHCLEISVVSAEAGTRTRRWAVSWQTGRPHVWAFPGRSFAVT